MVFLSADEESRPVLLILQGNSMVSSETTIFLTRLAAPRRITTQSEDSSDSEFGQKGGVIERSLNRRFGRSLAFFFIWSEKSESLIVTVACSQVCTCHRPGNRTKRRCVKEHQTAEFRLRIADLANHHTSQTEEDSSRECTPEDG